MIPAGGWGRRERERLDGEGQMEDWQSPREEQRTLLPHVGTPKGLSNSLWEDMGAPNAFSSQ